MSTDTKQLLKSLSQANHKQVKKVVMQFANTYPEAGILLLERDQVYQDVIEAVKLQTLFPANQASKLKRGSRYAN